MEKVYGKKIDFQRPNHPPPPLHPKVYALFTCENVDILTILYNDNNKCFIKKKYWTKNESELIVFV